MGFLSHRRRDVEVHPEQKWDYINLNDFKHTSCFQPFAYGYLWFSLFLAVAVYAVDIFTAYQLLAFNKWSSQIEPTQLIPFDISKWIFTICIILSFVNLVYEYLRAVRIMRRGSVAECFLDALAARLETIRMGSGRGWKRFLVFADLTDSKKGSEYIALFTFFSFQSWIRVLVCAGPRQVINGLTLYSVYDAKLQIQSDSFEAGIADFFDKIKALATEEPRQSVILCGMIFTLVIWIFSFLSLVLAGLFFVFYLWSAIPRADGGLTGFCERKVNKRLKEIVAKKINKAMADQERKRRKAELKAAKQTGGDRPLTMKPSLPVVLGGDNMPPMPSLDRADTFASFAEKPSRPSTPGSFEMNSLGQKPPMPMRSGTMATSASQFSSKASLMGGAAAMGMSGPDSPASTLPPYDRGGYPPSRTATGTSNMGLGPGSQPQRMPSNGSSLRSAYTASPAMYSSENMPSLPPRVMSPAMHPNPYRGPGQQRDRWQNSGDSRPTMDSYGAPTPSRDRWQNSGDSRPIMDGYGAPTPSRDRWQNSGDSRPTMDDYARPNQPTDRWRNPGDDRPDLPAMDDFSVSGQPRDRWPSPGDGRPTLPALDMNFGTGQPSDRWANPNDSRQPTLPVLDGDTGSNQPRNELSSPGDNRQPTLPVLDRHSETDPFSDGRPSLGDGRQPTLPTLDRHSETDPFSDRRASLGDRRQPTLPVLDDYSGPNESRDGPHDQGDSRRPTLPTMDTSSGPDSSKDKWLSPGDSRPTSPFMDDFLDSYSRRTESRDGQPPAVDSRPPSLPPLDHNYGPSQSKDRWPNPGDSRPTSPFLDDYYEPNQLNGRANPGDSSPTLDRVHSSRDRSPDSPHQNSPGPNPLRDLWADSEDSRPAVPTLPVLPALPSFDDFASGRGSPAPSTTSFGAGPISPRGIGPGYPPVRSATNPIPPLGPLPMPPPRTMTAPIQSFHRPIGSNESLRGAPIRPFHQPTSSNSSLGSAPAQSFHQPTGSNGSLRNAPVQAFHQPSGSNGSLRNAPIQPPFHQSTGSNGSQRSMQASGRPYDQPDASNSSLRNVANAGTLQQPESSGAYEFESPPNPMMARLRGPPGEGYGNSNGWNEDLERGPRY